MKATATVSPAPALLHLAIGTQGVAEQALAAGYDGVVVDLQHGEVGLERACSTLRSLPRTVPWRYVRVDAVDSGKIGRLLDSGATGIIAPTVETVAEAEALVAATKYPPLGRRSLGPSRPALYDVAGDYGATAGDYTSAGNATVSTIVQIETAQGVERSDEILALPGIDSVYVGPADLALSYGLEPRVDWRDGVVRDAIERLSQTARGRGLTFSVFCASPTYAADLISDGLVDWVGLGIDLSYISRAAAAAIVELRKDRT